MISTSNGVLNTEKTSKRRNSLCSWERTSRSFQRKPLGDLLVFFLPSSEVSANLADQSFYPNFLFFFLFFLLFAASIWIFLEQLASSSTHIPSTLTMHNGYREYESIFNNLHFGEHLHLYCSNCIYLLCHYYLRFISMISSYYHTPSLMLHQTHVLSWNDQMESAILYCLDTKTMLTLTDVIAALVA